MPKLIVNLAVIACEAGTTASTFLANNAATVTASSGLMAASATDFAVGVNVDTFGTCKADPKKKPCIPVTPFPWSFAVVRLPLVGQPAITDTSQLTCVKFGKKKITVASAGQVTIEIEDSAPKEGLLDRVSGAFGGAADAVWNSRHELLSAASVIPGVGAAPGIADQVLYYGEGMAAKSNGDQVAAEENLCKGHYAGAAAISSLVGGKALKMAGAEEVHEAIVGAVLGLNDSIVSDENCK